MLAEMKMHGGDRTKDQDDSVSTCSLESLGITPKQSSRWQQEAKVSEGEFVALVQEANETGDELTQAKLLKIARGAHVANNSCDNEWYTPEQYIAPFREAFGGIDVDPASCEFANRQVKAKRVFTIEQDGLSKQWKGVVWINPPYASGAVEPFAKKLIEEYESGRSTDVACLVNNATETKWFQSLVAKCSAVCFIAGRIRFLKETEEKNSPLQGQVILYFGKKASAFSDAYEEIGTTLFSKGAVE